MPRKKTDPHEENDQSRSKAEDLDRDDREDCREGRDHGPECPLCAVMGVLGRKKSRHTDFFGHLRQAESEVLKAFRSLIDDRLEEFEERNRPRKATKIKVT